jgi:methylated-DNA-[protein]-cysteine S-methyltransferase
MWYDTPIAASAMTSNTTPTTLKKVFISFSPGMDLAAFYTRTREPFRVLCTMMRIETPIGPLNAAFDEEGRLTELGFRESSSRRADESSRRDSTTGRLDDLTTQLREYFSGKRKTFDYPLAPKGTPFQLAVWNALLDIAYGDTITYAELALRIGKPSAIRAVGAANGANPIPVIIPCHRVIGSNGTLTGYGGGIERKQGCWRWRRRLF